MFDLYDISKCLVGSHWGPKGLHSHAIDYLLRDLKSIKTSPNKYAEVCFFFVFDVTVLSISMDFASFLNCTV